MNSKQKGFFSENYIPVDAAGRPAHVPVVLAAHRQRGAGLRLRRGGMLRGWNHLHIFNGNSNRGAGLCRETSSISLVSDTCLYPTGGGRYTVRPASLLCHDHFTAAFPIDRPIFGRRGLARKAGSQTTMKGALRCHRRKRAKTSPCPSSS